MIRLNPRIIPLLVLSLVAAGRAQSQVTTGTPPFGSFSGGPDIINNASLNAHLAVPVVSKGGRGNGFNYVFTYDSSVWYPVGTPGAQTWTPVTGWGWRGISEIVVGYVTYYSTQSRCYDGHSWHYWNIYVGWQYHDPFGVPHSLAVAAVSSWSSSFNCGGPNQPPFSATGASIDGSGYSAYVDAGPSATVYTRSGETVAAPLMNPSGPGSRTDPNSNTISTNGLSFTDTLGMTALQVTGTPPNPVYFKYYNSVGSQVSVVVSYTTKSVKTNFGCAGITEKTQSSVPLVYRITFPDTTYYEFSYEDTPGFSGYVTGRMESIRLPTGGAISYTYTGGSSGHITCSDGSASGLDRQIPDGTWSYTRSGGNTTITSPGPDYNQTVLTFYNIYETQRQVYQGGSTLLRTIHTCYSNSTGTPPPDPPCTGPVSPPVARRAVTVTLNDVTPNLTAKSETYFDTYGLPTETDEYDYGPTLIRKTTFTYDRPGGANCGVTNSHVLDRPCVIQVYDSAPSLKAETDYAYSANGNLLTETRYAGGTPTTISRSFTYSTGGVLQTSTDFNSHQTTYTNNGCSSSFPTTISMPLSLSTSATWNCYLGRPSTATDVNQQQANFAYDSMLRLTSTTVPGGGWTLIVYPSATQIDTYIGITDTTPSQTCTGCRHDSVGLDDLGRVVHPSKLDTQGRVC